MRGEMQRKKRLKIDFGSTEMKQSKQSKHSMVVKVLFYLFVFILLENMK